MACDYGQRKLTYFLQTRRTCAWKEFNKAVSEYNKMVIPGIGMGTFGNDKYSAKETADAVYNAIKVGYRLFDCAAAYGNEKDIGQFKEVMCRFHFQFTKMSMQEICVR